MRLDRAKNGLRNIFWGLISKVVSLLFPFAIRTVMVQTLGAEYLGLNSLFTSILTVLNLAELGFSTAVVFNMYKPIAENDKDTICALMNFYRKAYFVVGLVVLAVGLIMIPVLPYFVHGSYPANLDIVSLYILFLMNSAVSYFLFAYRGAILSAYQREDVVSKVNIVLRILMYSLQIASLIIWKDYYLFVVLMVVNTILTNVVIAYWSKRMFPEYKCKGELSKSLKSNIKRNIGGLMIGKVCLVSRNSFDSIFLSIFLGLTTVALYGNYYYIMNAVCGVLILLLNSMAAGIGNSIAMESEKKNYEDMKILVFLYSWISAWCMTCLFNLYQPFMTIWMGSDMLFPISYVALFCLYFYFLTMGDVRSQYASGAGLFWENRKYVIAEACANIVLNFILGKYFGVPGIICATLITILCINFFWGSAVLFKHYFKHHSVFEFYKMHFKYLAAALLAAGCTYLVTMNIVLDPMLELIADFFVCCVVPNIVLLVFHARSQEFKNAVVFLRQRLFVSKK